MNTELTARINLGNYALYRDRAEGIVLANITTGKSIYFQPGDESNDLAKEVESHLRNMRHEDNDKAIQMWNDFMSTFDPSMSTPEEAQGAPSRDGDIYVFFR